MFYINDTLGHGYFLHYTLIPEYLEFQNQQLSLQNKHWKFCTILFRLKRFCHLDLGYLFLFFEVLFEKRKTTILKKFYYQHLFSA